MAEGRPRAAPETVSPASPAEAPLARILSDIEPPLDAYVAVRYRNCWFWIDARDIESKRTFMFLRVFPSIAETGIMPQAPIITIPAN